MDVTKVMLEAKKLTFDIFVTSVTNSSQTSFCHLGLSSSKEDTPTVTPKPIP